MYSGLSLKTSYYRCLSLRTAFRVRVSPYGPYGVSWCIVKQVKQFFLKFLCKVISKSRYAAVPLFHLHYAGQLMNTWQALTPIEFLLVLYHTRLPSVRLRADVSYFLYYARATKEIETFALRQLSVIKEASRTMSITLSTLMGIGTRHQFSLGSRNCCETRSNQTSGVEIFCIFPCISSVMKSEGCSLTRRFSMDRLLKKNPEFSYLFEFTISFSSQRFPPCLFKHWLRWVN